MSNDKTLATAKHGGCVQLGDGLPPIREDEPLRGDEPAGEQHDARMFNRGWNACREAAAALSAQPSPGGQGDALLESLVARWRNHAEEIGVSDNLLCQKISNCTMRHAAELQAALAARQPVGEPVDAECEGCKGGIRYDAKGCICTTCGKRPKWYMAGRRIRVTERRKPWKHFGAPVSFEAECTWQMGDSIDYRLDGETTSRRLNNFHQHWEKVEVIR